MDSGKLIEDLFQAVKRAEEGVTASPGGNAGSDASQLIPTEDGTESEAE